MNVPQLRPLGIGEILDVSLKIAWRNARTLIPIVLFVVGPAQLVTALVQVSAEPEYDPRGSPFSPFSTTVAPAADQWTIIAAALVSVVLGFLASQLATGASFKAVAQAYLGERPHWRDSLAFALRRFRSIIWIVVLGGFLTVLGFLFLIVPGIYLAVAFAVALPVLMTEGTRGLDALRRSRRLVSGRWWKTAILLVVAGLLTSVVGGAITAAVAAVVFAQPDEPVVVFAVSALAGTVAAAITTPFSAAYHTVLYFDLRVRKEAFDLQLLAEHLGVEPPESWEPAPPTEPPPAAEGDQPPYWPPPPGWRSGSGAQ